MKFISIKILILLFSNLAFPPLAQIMSNTIDQPARIVFFVFVAALFLPEVGIIISRKFRHWLKAAIENNDGVLDGGDLKELITYLAAYYCAKLFALGMLVDIFYTIEINETYLYLAFSGFAGTTGLVQLQKIFHK